MNERQYIKKQATSVVVDIDPDAYAPSIGVVEIYRHDGSVASHDITPRTVGRALEAQRLMLAKIEREKAGAE